MAVGPSLDDVRAWIQIPASVVDDAQLQRVLDGEMAVQAQLCSVPVDPEPLPDELVQALYRRVARVIRLRSLPTGMVGDSDEFGPIQAARHDAEITRLEATHRIPVLG